MHRKPWMILSVLTGMAILALPAAGQSGYAYEVNKDGKPQVWVSAQSEASATADETGDPNEVGHVRIVLSDDKGGEPKTYEWKTVDGKTVSVSGDADVHFLEEMGRRGYLGVGLVELTPELREHFGAVREAGVMVGSVEPGSPAESAGVKVGDVITALDGETMGSSWDIRKHIRALEDGDTVAIEVLRDGSRQSLTANVVEKERPEVDIRRLVGHLGDNPNIFEVDPGEMKDVMVDLKQHFDSPEFRYKVEAFGSHEKELEEKLQALEAKIEELQKRLDEKK